MHFWWYNLNWKLRADRFFNEDIFTNFVWSRLTFHLCSRHLCIIHYSSFSSKNILFLTINSSLFTSLFHTVFCNNNLPTTCKLISPQHLSSFGYFFFYLNIYTRQQNINAITSNNNINISSYKQNITWPAIKLLNKKKNNNKKTVTPFCTDMRIGLLYSFQWRKDFILWHDSGNYRSIYSCY